MWDLVGFLHFSALFCRVVIERLSFVTVFNTTNGDGDGDGVMHRGLSKTPFPLVCIYITRSAEVQGVRMIDLF